MDPANREQLDGFLREKALQLFADYQLPLAETLEPASDAFGESLVGVIGLVGECITATLAIAATQQVLEATFPMGDAVQPEDWMGELANQLIGRFKNELGRWGLDTSIGTPVTVVGSRLALRAGPDVGCLHFDSAHGPVHVWLKAEEIQPFTLVADSTECMAEGDFCLF